MARKIRVHYEGAIYHVIARGNNQERIFLDPGDKIRYLELVIKYKQKYSYDILAYVLMDNHLHMLLRINRIPLAKVMQGVQQCYTQYFNRKYNRVGHVFQQRYKSFLCENDRYLAALIVYIHQNPVRAGLREGICYPWSSHNDYVAENNLLVNIDFILDMLHSDRSHAVRQYLNMFEERRASPAPSEVNLPGEAFVRRGNDNKESDKKNQLTWDEIVEKIVHDFNVKKEKLLGPCRERKIVAARNMLIYEAVIHEVLSRKELANRLKIDPARITRGFQKAEELRCINPVSQ
ncbi:MAG: transposase [Firmicutes bacterium]|nr:transposase [Bacillota bacterium]